MFVGDDGERTMIRTHKRDGLQNEPRTPTVAVPLLDSSVSATAIALRRS